MKPAEITTLPRYTIDFPHSDGWVTREYLSAVAHGSRKVQNDTRQRIAVTALPIEPKVTSTEPVLFPILHRTLIYGACALVLFSGGTQTNEFDTRPLEFDQAFSHVAAELSVQPTGMVLIDEVDTHGTVISEVTQLSNISEFAEKLNTEVVKTPQFAIDVLNKHFWDLL